MTNHFTLAMAKATALTKAGKLTEATALIQSALQNTPPPAAAPDDGVIEGMFTRLDDPVTDDKPTSPPPLPPRRRASLRDTLARLRTGAMQHSGGFASPATPLPAGAQFLTLTHTSPHGQRDCKLYIPAAKPATAMPLILMLHGCTQSPDDFAAGTGMNALAERHGFMVAYPAQPASANANKCWNWFKPDDQARDAGEPALIAGIVSDILRAYPADPKRIYVAGLSAGGAAAAIMGAAYPDIFSAVGVHSGLAVGAARDIPQALTAMRSGAKGGVLTHAVPTISIHGTADKTVHPRNGKAVVAQAVRTFGPLTATTQKSVSAGGKRTRQTRHTTTDGRAMVEQWEIDGAGHAWAGGHAAGSYTDPTGPDASAEMIRFFLQHTKP